MPEGWDAWHGNPVRLGPEDVPLPDLSLILGPLGRYRHRSPVASDVGLVIEIDTSDRASRYARAGVPTYWVADAVRGRIIEHRGPRVVGGVASYETVAEHGAGGGVELVLDGVAVGRVALADVF